MDSEYWMIPDEIKDKLAKLFVAFRIKYPNVEINDLTDFVQQFNKIIDDFQEKEENSIKQ